MMSFSRTRRRPASAGPRFAHLGRLFTALIFIFLYAPIFVMIVFSFNDSKSRTVISGFTLDWYAELLQDTTILSSLYTTLSVAVLSALIATVIGTAAAIGIHVMRGPRRALMLNLNNIPVVSPDIITGVSLRMLFVAVLGFFAIFGLNIKLGFATLLMAHITFCIPYVILSVLPKLSQMGKHIYEAALDLGATPRRALWKVVLPQILPGVVSGALISFTLSIDDFLISYFTAGNTSQTLPMVVYAMTRKRLSPKINALSTLMFVVVLALLILINLFQARQDKKRRLEEHRRI
jgi:spermidine/putrescine transport system permease protein